MSDHNGSTQSPAKSVVRNVSDLASNAIALAELQTELFKLELQQWFRSMIAPIVLLIAAMIIVLGTVPVLLFSFAQALTDMIGWSHALSLLCAALVALVVVVIAAVLGVKKLRRSLTTLEHSRAEFSRNLKWLKQVLRSQPKVTESGVETPVGAR